MTDHRPDASSITDDELDALYARAERAETQAREYRQRILDIDAHATAYGVREGDFDGSPTAYLITVGSLRRALGTVGHTAPPCDAEARLAAVRAEHARDDSNPLGPWCGTCIGTWPCATMTALDGPFAT